ncbi:MAG: transporter substrate-binding domain-containing protein [Rhizobiales bacterium]|nr:transporter substrate-binding domain-containing protein [Hyphomicrobiales bacterium]
MTSGTILSRSAWSNSSRGRRRSASAREAAVEAEPRLPTLPVGTSLRLLADEDFPPFSFRARSGAPSGLAVDLAASACATLRAECTVNLMPLSDLLPALAAGQGEMIVAGPRIDAAALSDALMTRPWFRSLARFASQSGSPLASGDAAGLAGKRIGFVKASTHGAFLERYYGAAKLVAFDSDSLAQEALRTGNVDALFGDGLRLIYWVAGEASRGCCKLLPGAYSDPSTFSRNFAFLVRANRPDLRQAFDAALDKLQSDGATEKLFNAYVPLNPW